MGVGVKKYLTGVRPGFSQPYPWLRIKRTKSIPLPVESVSQIHTLEDRKCPQNNYSSGIFMKLFKKGQNIVMWFEGRVQLGQNDQNLLKTYIPLASETWTKIDHCLRKFRRVGRYTGLHQVSINVAYSIYAFLDFMPLNKVAGGIS